MTSKPARKDRYASRFPKRFFPTGSVDQVLLTGSTGSRSLTLFESIGLILTGLGIALGVGFALIVGELHFEAIFDRDFGQLFVGGAFLLWGVAILSFGIVGVAKAVRRRKRV